MRNDELKGVAFNSSLRIHHSSFSLLNCAASKRTRKERGVRSVSEEKEKVSNEISDGTGQFDARFVLWRRFCADNNIPVETLPSDLTGEAKERWEQLKSEQLRKPAEEEKP